VEEDHHYQHDPRGQPGFQEEDETPMMMKKDLDESQMRVGKEDRTRDPPPSQKKTTMTSRTMNSLTCSHEQWPTRCDNKRESRQNTLQSLETRNTRMYVCGYYHIRIILVQTGGNGKTRHNESILHKPNGRERSRTVCVNLPTTNDRRNRLYETRKRRVLACLCRTSPATLRSHP